MPFHLMNTTFDPEDYHTIILEVSETKDGKGRLVKFSRKDPTKHPHIEWSKYPIDPGYSNDPDIDALPGTVALRRG